MRILRNSAIGIAALAIVALGGLPTGSAPAVAAAQTAPAGVTVPSDAAAVTAAILRQTNSHRAAAGLQPLRASTFLNTFAQNCTLWQANSKRMAHCKAPAQFGSAWAENVASGQRPSQVVMAWMNSAGHRANILNPRLTHLGVGYALDSNGRTYYTQNFQLPR